MALDHVRDMMHINSISQSPTDLTTTTPILFFTRWITYLCAPIFVFLAGTSAYFSYKKDNDITRSRKFLLKRGLYLLLLEFLVVNFALFFDLGFHTFIFEVIAAIGFGFIILSLVFNIPKKAIAAIGFAVMCCHDLFIYIPFKQGSTIQTVCSLLFMPGAFPFLHRIFIMGYPPIPWLAIMLIGFASGKLFEIDRVKRKYLFLKISLGAVFLFLVLRFINVYGDPSSWAFQRNGLYTFLSFMNITKYPPSLLFCLITLGIMFCLLAFAETARNIIFRIISVYGKVPLFYFLIHFFLIHLVLLAVMFLQGFSWNELDFASGTFGRPKGLQSGLHLWQIYLIWIGVVVLLYKPCKLFGKYKSTHKKWWLKYV